MTRFRHVCALATRQQQAAERHRALCGSHNCIDLVCCANMLEVSKPPKDTTVALCAPVMDVAIVCYVGKAMLGKRTVQLRCEFGGVGTVLKFRVLNPRYTPLAGLPYPTGKRTVRLPIERRSETRRLSKNSVGCLYLPVGNWFVVASPSVSMFCCCMPPPPSPSRVLITSAGIHSVYESFFHGLPLVSLPFTKEQLGNAQVATWRGGGLISTQALVFMTKGSSRCNKGLAHNLVEATRRGNNSISGNAGTTAQADGGADGGSVDDINGARTDDVRQDAQAAAAADAHLDGSCASGVQGSSGQGEADHSSASGQRELLPEHGCRSFNSSKLVEDVMKVKRPGGGVWKGIGYWVTSCQNLLR